MASSDSVSWEVKPHTEWTRDTYEDNAVPRNVSYIDNLKLDPSLQPKRYEMEGTHCNSKILFIDVNILDSTGRLPYHGDVLIEGKTTYNVF